MGEQNTISEERTEDGFGPTRPSHYRLGRLSKGLVWQSEQGSPKGARVLILDRVTVLLGALQMRSSSGSWDGERTLDDLGGPSAFTRVLGEGGRVVGREEVGCQRQREERWALQMGKGPKMSMASRS